MQHGKEENKINNLLQETLIPIDGKEKRGL